MDVILQAGLVFPLCNTFFRNRLSAGSRLIDFVDDLKQGIHAADVGIGTEILPPFLVDGSRLEHPREILFRHADGRVGLAVFQQNVVARIVFLDKSVFQQQGILLGVNHRVGDVPYL